MTQMSCTAHLLHLGGWTEPREQPPAVHKKRKDSIAGKVDTNMDAVKRRREAEKMKPGPLDVRQFSLQYFYFRKTLNLIVFLCF